MTVFFLLKPCENYNFLFEVIALKCTFNNHQLYQWHICVGFGRGIGAKVPNGCGLLFYLKCFRGRGTTPTLFPPPLYTLLMKYVY